MKIVIISGFAYPTQNPRAFRTSELAEELVRRGHEVVVYSPLGDFDYPAYETETGVVMRDIPSVMSLQRPNVTKGRNLITKVLWRLLSGLVEIPNVEYSFRVPRIIQRETRVDLLITIAVPHMINVGAAKAKLRHPGSFPKVWIADSGDPDFLNPMYHSPFYMEKLERRWCRLCDFITVPTEESRKGYFNEFADKIFVIPQGFDFSKTPLDKYVPNPVPTFAFAGRIYPGQRDLTSFMEYLVQIDTPFNFKIITFSDIDKKYQELSKGRIEIISGMHRRDVIKELSRCDFLVNITNPDSVQTPSKLIDYALCRRPVLNISNHFHEHEQFAKFCVGNYEDAAILPSIEGYRIENVTDSFLSLYQKARMD